MRLPAWIVMRLPAWIVARLPPWLAKERRPRTIAALVLLVLLLTLLGQESARALLAFAAVVALPGYLLSAAFAPSSTSGVPERLLQIFGIGLATPVLAFLITAILPPQMDRRAWIVLPLCAVVVGLLVLRRRGADDTPRQAPNAIRPASLLVLGLALAIAAAAVTVAESAPLVPQGPGFTQLWSIAASEGSTLSIGVENHEGASTTYRVEVAIEGDVLAAWPNERLSAGARWERLVAIPRQELGKRISVALYLPGSSVPYRETWISPETGV